MNKREAKREVRAALACHARWVAEQIADPSPDGERLRAAYTEVAQFLDPLPLVDQVDPDQLTLDVGAGPDAGGTP